MKTHLPGLTKEKNRSGKYSWRVRPVGQKRRKINVPPPDSPDFPAAYEAARRGEKLQVSSGPVRNSLRWLVAEYEASMQASVKAGLLSPATEKQRSVFYDRLCAKYGDKEMAMPKAKLIEFRDSMIETPGAADNMVKSVRALYKWAVDREIVKDNPATGIPKINRGKGAVPWSIDDLRQFRGAHPQGTMAHLALTLFMFTSCRVGDVVLLGRDHEARRDGLSWLEWQPGKKGSSPVSVPILPPLARSISAQKIIGPTYLLNGWGKPFASPAAYATSRLITTPGVSYYGRTWPHQCKDQRGLHAGC